MGGMVHIHATLPGTPSLVAHDDRFAEILTGVNHQKLIVAVVLALVPQGFGQSSRSVLTDRPEPLSMSLPVEDDAFLFSVFGDRTGGPPEGIEVLRQAVRDTNLIDPDLVMTVGDLVQGYNTRPAWMTQMTEFRGVMSELDCPWFPVAGNHDVYWRGPGRPPDEHEGDYEAFFGPLWYAFDHKGCRFIVLYTDEGNPQTGERTFSKPASQRMSGAQRAFLAEALATSSDKRHVFVFCHHPRWRGGGYGDDWETVHEMLVAAGNVSAVFAGHVHQLQSDGVRDGIEYLTLATVGGHLADSNAAAGHLDHVLHVMVRDAGIAMAAVPVGDVIDPRGMTAGHNTRAEVLMRSAPSFPPIHVAADGAYSGRADVVLTNPSEVPVTWSVQTLTGDARWRIRPDHLHETIEPGASVTVPFELSHSGPLDAAWAPPRLESRVAFRDDAGSWRMTGLGSETICMATNLPAAEGSGVLSLDGGSSSARVPSEAIPLADGPFTIETWVRPTNLAGRRGLLAKTESSEYGIFASDWMPTFYLHVDGAYTEVMSNSPLDADVWQHVAGVFDGAEIRLYVDGMLVGRADARGTRTRNTHPLVVGGDVDGQGRSISCIDGSMDDVRLSTVARYAGDAVEPPTSMVADDDTRLLLRFDAVLGPFAADRSGREAHATLTRGARVREGVSRD